MTCILIITFITDFLIAFFSLPFPFSLEQIVNYFIICIESIAAVVSFLGKTTLAEGMIIMLSLIIIVFNIDISDILFSVSD